MGLRHEVRRAADRLAVKEVEGVFDGRFDGDSHGRFDGVFDGMFDERFYGVFHGRFDAVKEVESFCLRLTILISSYMVLCRSISALYRHRRRHAGAPF